MLDQRRGKDICVMQNEGKIFYLVFSLILHTIFRETYRNEASRE